MDGDICLLQIVAASSSLQTHSPNSTRPPGPDHVPTHSSMRDSSEQDLMGPNDDDDNNNNNSSSSSNNREKKEINEKETQVLSRP